MKEKKGKWTRNNMEEALRMLLEEEEEKNNKAGRWSFLRSKKNDNIDYFARFSKSFRSI